jgi:hypothetical protein
MPIVTPNILPGEEGYVSKKERNKVLKVKEKKERNKKIKADSSIGKIRPGKFRIGKSIITPRGERKYPIWKFSRQIGEIVVSNKGLQNEEIELSFNRFGGIGSYKHLIQDADFRKKWMIREQELLMTQKECYVCKKKLSKSSTPNLYHYNMWRKRSRLLEDAEKVPLEVVNGKLTIDEGWAKFNDILEQGNRYYMSLKDTALVCSVCAKQKNLQY